MYSEYTKRLINEEDSFDFVAAHFACEQDKYSVDNPNGYVNFGSAQNFLSKVDVAERLKSPSGKPKTLPTVNLPVATLADTLSHTTCRRFRGGVFLQMILSLETE